MPHSSKAIYELANVDEKRLLLSQLFTNFVQKERKIETFSTPIMTFMQKWIPKLNESYELQKSLNNGANKGVADSLVSATPIWLRALHAFRTAIGQIPGNISPFKIVNYW